MTKRKKTPNEKLMNLIVIADTHCGCKFGLCPPKVTLDDGMVYHHTPIQRDTWKRWNYFWDEWVPVVTKGEPYGLLINGDSLDGKHHGAVTQVSQNLTDQAIIAKACLKPVLQNPLLTHYWHIRGTEAHVGPSGQEEERLARELGAIPDAEGRCARWELFIEIGSGLVHATHHIGSASPFTVQKELESLLSESARWGEQHPDVVVRSHIHSHAEVRTQTKRGFGTSFTTPGWQAKTPFGYRIASGRVKLPQIGGSIIRAGDEDHIYTRYMLWNLRRPRVEKPRI